MSIINWILSKIFCAEVINGARANGIKGVFEGASKVRARRKKWIMSLVK